MPVLAEPHGGPAGEQPPPPPPMANMSVQLSQLVDLTVHKTYHQLSVLAEILSAKEDMTRKLEIISFVKLKDSNRKKNRQLVLNCFLFSRYI
jgi:hypothetical protein